MRDGAGETIYPVYNFAFDVMNLLLQNGERSVFRITRVITRRVLLARFIL